MKGKNSYVLDDRVIITEDIKKMSKKQLKTEIKKELENHRKRVLMYHGQSCS